MCEAAPSNDSGSSRNSSPRPKLRPTTKPKPKPAPKKKTSPAPSYATMSVGEKGRGGSTSSAVTNQTKADIAMGRTAPKTASIGYGIGQVDPRLAKAAGVKDSGSTPVTSGNSVVKSSSGSIVTSPRPKTRPTTTSGGGDSSPSSSSSKSAPAPAPAAAPAGGPATTPLSLNESYSDKKPSTARRRRRGGKRQFTNNRQGTGIGGVGGGVGLNIPK